jgi:hypothetical protein
MGKDIIMSPPQGWEGNYAYLKVKEPSHYGVVGIGTLPLTHLVI